MGIKSRSRRRVTAPTGRANPSNSASDGKRSPVGGKGTISRYKRGELIFAQGDAADTVLYLLNGLVKTSVHSRGGKEALLNILGPGEYFGVQ